MVPVSKYPINLAKRIEDAENKFAESLYKTAFARKEAIAMINGVLKEEINVEDVIKDELERRPKLIKDLNKILIKARHAATASGLVSLADDSGLSVRGLDGQPGIYSARWAGPGKDFYPAMARVERELGDRPDRTGFFTCALAVAWPDGSVFAVEGIVEGSLIFPPRGDRGFGYDPIFIPEGGDQTFGEMDPDAKEAISHRTRAFRTLKEALID